MMSKKFLLISEVLTPPFDEGIKNVAFSIHKKLTLKFQTLSITKAGNSKNNSGILPVGLNKLFLNYGLKKIIKSFAPDFIIYIPEASITFNSFVRAKVLKFMSPYSRVIILGVKQVDYSSVQRKIILSCVRPDALLLMGKFEQKFFKENGVRVGVLPPAVDPGTAECPSDPGPLRASVAAPRHDLARSRDAPQSPVPTETPSPGSVRPWIRRKLPRTPPSTLISRTVRWSLRTGRCSPSPRDFWLEQWAGA